MAWLGIFYMCAVLVQGAALIVAATSVAATTAFFAARGILRPLAEKVVSSEMRGVRHTVMEAMSSSVD